MQCSCFLLQLILSTLTFILSIPRRQKHLLTQKNAFHRIYSENYMLNDDIINTTNENDSNLSKNSNYSPHTTTSFQNLSSSTKSFKSLSANTLNSAVKIPSLSSSASSTFNFNMSPTSAYKSYSNFNQFNLNNNSFLPSSSKSVYSDTRNKLPSFKSNSIIDQFSVYSLPTSSKSRNLNLIFNQPFLNSSKTNTQYNSCNDETIQSNNSFRNSSSVFSNSPNTRRLNLLSPSRFGEKSEYTLTPSYDVYLNNNSINSLTKKRNFLNITEINTKENLSRDSSQSSGFESQISSNTLNSGNILGENSLVDLCTRTTYGGNNNIDDDRNTLSPFPSSVSEFNLPISSSSSTLPTLLSPFQEIWDLSNKNKNQTNLNITNNTFSPKFARDRRKIELINDKKNKNNPNLYLNQTIQTPNDPFDLNNMNKDLSSIEEDDNIWRLQQH